MVARLYLVFGIISLCFVLILFRLFHWQVLSFDQLKGLAEDQTTSSITIPAKRGRIYTADGSSLVINQKAYLVYADIPNLSNPLKTIKTLSEMLQMPESSLSAKILSSKNVWVPIASKVNEDIANKIRELKIPGLNLVEESKRYYPEASMAAHLLGFVGKNSKGSDQGYFGIEGYYDEQLRGREGILKQEQDAVGNPILSGRRTEIPTEDGRDLTLTIDKTVQYIAEMKLKESMEKYGAKGGTVTIMDPSTGAVLAMVAYPSYDPGSYYDYSEQFFINPIVALSYEPGSTFKVLVMAAAINENKITKDTTYDENGSVEIGGYTINTWNQQYHGKISMNQILEYSSNVGMVFVGEKLGNDALIRYIKDLGFGSSTDIDLQEETSPQLRPLNSWYAIDYATATFGQGIAVTPIQMIRAVASIANGGKLMRPYIVQKIKLANGKTIETKPHVDASVFSANTSRTVSEMMADAVDNGEAKRLKPAGYRIAGKTGTAQIALSGHYDSQKTIASFIGFAPVENPKFIMLVTLSEPSTSQWGSETAAPTFFRIAKELFTYYGISPKG